MRRIQRSTDHPGEQQFRVWQRRERKESVRKLTLTSVFLVLVGLVGPVIPKYGYLMWTVGWGVCLVLFVASIMMMAKDAPARGLLALLLAVIVLPIWIAVAPIAVMKANDAYAWKQLLQELQKQKGVAQSSVLPPDMPGGSEGLNALLAAAGQAPATEGVETVTSKDGRTIRGTVLAYDTWGVRLKRDDGQVVNVGFELMSAEDMQKFRDRYNHQSSR